ncbi:recombinase family protein [Salipiger bermudensis]|uniref:recombinase family protein n=1 Tax=Salipiger bermudensis TaxID=344736 RepID=UPI001C9937AA|nr:recombinase family protein [Salipiger bermudensis]MBY6006703.1 recombinase family protein [Salipiger bermudensis]
MTKRAAVYARYSSNLQSPTSIEDQVAMAKRFCDRQGWTMVNVFSDYEKTGRNTRRPGFQAMKRAADNMEFDIVVVEDIDRLNRKLTDALRIYDILTFQSIELHSLEQGKQDFLKVLFAGYGAQLLSEKIGQKTRRGMQGAVTRQRLHTSAYGYRKVEVETGLNREIDLEQAAIVHRIFREFASGRSSAAIAEGLNLDKVPAPRGGSWDGSTIRGNPATGEGILRNQLYIGIASVCRNTHTYHPETLMKKIRPSPDKLVEQEIPELRLIEQPLWNAVQAELARRGAATPRAARAARRKSYLLSGLLICGCCGAPYVMSNRTSYGCREARKKACNNTVFISRRRIETRVFDALRQAFRSPALIASFEAALKAERKKLSGGTVKAQRDRLKAALTKAKAGRENILNAIAEGAPYAAFKARTDVLEREITELTTRLSDLEARIAQSAEVQEDARVIYERALQQMETLLSDPELVDEAHGYLATLIQEVTLTPDETALNGIAAVLSLASGVFPDTANAADGGTRISC